MNPRLPAGRPGEEREEKVVHGGGRRFGPDRRMTIRVPLSFADVFASQPLAGNPLPLVPDADVLDQAQMRAWAFAQQDLDAPAQVVSTGAAHLMVPARDRTAVLQPHGGNCRGPRDRIRRRAAGHRLAHLAAVLQLAPAVPSVHDDPGTDSGAV